MLTGKLGEAVVQSTHIKVRGGAELTKVRRGIARICGEWNYEEITDARKAALIIYLGLCRLKAAKDEYKSHEGHSEKSLNMMEKEYNKWFSVLQFNGSGETLNVSRFRGNSDKYKDHTNIIKSAANYFKPGIKSISKHSAVLLALGSEFDLVKDKDKIPENDKWIEDYSFLNL